MDNRDYAGIEVSKDELLVALRRGEQTLPVSFAGGGRYVLKVEMDGEQSVPRFNLTAVKGR